jgi:hypothetical protein
MEDKRSLYRNRFDFFVNGFMSLVSISTSVYAISLVGGTTMTQPLPPIVLVGFIIAGIFALAALVNWIIMLRSPKDTRLDDLINAVKVLNQSIINLSLAQETIKTEQANTKSRFKMFTNEARDTLSKSLDIAHSHHRNAISPEDILLTILRGTDFRGNLVMRSIGANIAEMIEALINSPQKESTNNESGYLSKQIKEVIAHALDESRVLNKLTYVGTEHILLGLLLVGGTSGELLNKHGVDLEKVRTVSRQLPAIA